MCTQEVTQCSLELCVKCTNLLFFFSVKALFPNLVLSLSELSFKKLESSSGPISEQPHQDRFFLVLESSYFFRILTSHIVEWPCFSVFKFAIATVFLKLSSIFARLFPSSDHEKVSLRSFLLVAHLVERVTFWIAIFLMDFKFFALISPQFFFHVFLINPVLYQ